MPRPRSPLADYAVYLVVRLLVCFVQALPFRAACAFADGLAWLAYRVDKRHRQVAHENLSQAYPQLDTTAKTDGLVRSVYHHFCTLIVEITHIPRRLHTTNWRRHVDLTGAESLVAALLSNRPLLLVTGHFGNWELGGYILGLLGFRTYAIARPLDNPHLDRFLRRFRENTGQQLLAKHGDFDHMQDILRGNGIIATLADQDAGQRGLFVNFFGRPASTHKAVALLAIEYRTPLIVIGMRKLGDPIRYRLVVEDIIPPEEYAQRGDAVRAITERFTTALERVVRAAPEQYFWVHRRWKHRPLARKGRAA